MNQRQTILNSAQSSLVADLCTTYGIEPDDIVFFTNDPNPLFGYQASCILLNRLTDITDRELEPVAPVSADSIARRCRLVFPDGSSSFIGVANLDETDEQGKDLSTSQLEWLADSRAIRGAIRAKGIILLNLHNAARNGEQSANAKPIKSNRATLISQAHVLGKEAFLIVGEDKSLYHRLLRNRYEGFNHTDDLNDEQLADWVAFLRVLAQPAKAQAAV